jgi:hypothetical protein
MRILFGALHFAYFRNFESVLCALAERGHTIHLTADEPEQLGGQALVEGLGARYPNVTWGWTPSVEDEAWFRLARRLRTGFDYVRFHEPAFASFEKTRRHLADRVPRAVRAVLQRPLGNNAPVRAVLARALRSAENAVPISDALREFIAHQAADVVLLASVTAWRAPQIDLLRAARTLGVRTGVCVWSWDHLSSKALLRGDPDRVFVWNGTQRQEAIQWHGVAPDRVVVTGAQCYDDWFTREPSRTREKFAGVVGLDPAHPFLLYVCSVMTPDPHEASFVLRWIDSIRSSTDQRLRDVGILIRPHPERMDEWSGVDLSRFGNVALYGANPVTARAKRDYFESLYYSEAVVGLVTSAFLEAAVVGRPVHTVTLPEFEAYQGGMAHFRYLLEVEGGLLHRAASLDEHARQLSRAIGAPRTRDAQNVRFLRAFVRPDGLDQPATPKFADAVEAMAAIRPSAAAPPNVIQLAARPLIDWIARSSERGVLRPVLRDAHEIANDRGLRAKAERRDERRAARDKAVAAEQAHREEQFRLRERRRHVARLKGRLKAMLGSHSR